MIICPTCQTPNRAEARFCMGCGVRLDAEPPVSAAPVPSTPAPMDEAALPQAAPVIPEPAPPLALPAAEVTSASVPPEAVLAGATPPAEPALSLDLAGDEDVASPALPAAPPELAGDEEVASSSAPAEPPLAVGAVIGERFTVVGLLEDQADGRIYGATDAGVCVQCGAPIVLGDQFCSNCGVEVSGPAMVRLRETLAMSEADALEVDGRWYVVLPAVAPAGPAATGWRLQVGQASDTGKVRELDEDSIFSLVLSGIYESQIETTVGLFLVADGIGGQEGGEVASKLAAQTIAQQVLQRIIWPILQGETVLAETVQEELRQAVLVANRQVYELRWERGNNMGATLTMALLINGQAIIGNVGDSRTYVWGPGGLVQVTEDHSLIAALIAAGEEPPEAIYTHPQRNLITRGLGDSPHVEVDLFSLELEPGFRLILCCDGVWEMIRNQGIEDIMLQEDHPQRAADKVVEWSNNAGGEDNISVVVVAVEQP
ncbi:MAG: protein phosphatase 2C domain-containing protein [Anaerolineae bacterium]